MLLSYVIPCYHSDQTISGVVRDILSTVDADGRFECEIILVNDNPPDRTWDVLKHLSERDQRVVAICQMRNFGQHAALMAGYRASKGDVVVSLDDDGQTPPSESSKLVDKILEGFDLVYCQYEGAEFANGFRKFGSDLNAKMAEWLINKPKGIYLSSYFAATRAVVDEVCHYTGPYPYVDGLFLRSAGIVGSVTVFHREREVGSSGYSLGKLVGLWLNGATAFSVKPLRLSMWIGILCAIFGLLAALVIVAHKLIAWDSVEAGWPSIMCLLLVIGGLVLASLGLVGEYVGRIYVSGNAAPQYVVREEWRNGKRCLRSEAQDSC